MSYVKTLFKFIAANICVLCQQFVDDKQCLCLACHRDLPWLKNVCSICSIPLNNAQSDLHCGSCIKTKPYYDQTIALFHYQNPIIKLITQFKFQQKLNYGYVLSQLLVNKLEKIYINPLDMPDIIIPVPLHRKKIRQRGFNQAVELAKPISKKLNISMDYNLAQRIRNTLPQIGLHNQQRRKNVRNAFQIKKPVAGSNVVIVDDVITTASTVNELSRVLKKNGADKVTVWCCARTTVK